MFFQVYFKRSLGSSEWDCLPEYCRTLFSLDNGKTAIINAGLVDNVFAHTGPRPVSELEGFYVPFNLPTNSVLQEEQINQWSGHPFQILGGYTVAGIIIQQDNGLLPNEYHEDCQQVSSIYVYFVLRYLYCQIFRIVCSNPL